MQKLVVLTGAGISAESGISTFRDSGGLWEGHDVNQVATPEGFAADPALVLDFYNQRRRQLSQVEPNEAHRLLAHLEKRYEVVIITQNVDDLHERAGSHNIIHLHGELLKSRGVDNPNVTYPCTGDIHVGDKSPTGAQLRPHIVWFGEEVSRYTDDYRHLPTGVSCGKPYRLCQGGYPYLLHRPKPLTTQQGGSYGHCTESLHRSGQGYRAYDSLKLLTASTKARACSTGTSGRIPCPKLAI